MGNEEHPEVNEELVRSHVCEVTDDIAWVLLQEPGFVGFGVVRSDAIWWPPDVRPDWKRVSDLRLFGENGEWHVWPHWDGTWRSRSLTAQDMTDTLTEYHVLWGTALQRGTSPWVTLVEKDRGTAIWLPIKLQDGDLPLRLKVEQVVGYDCKSGLAGVVDAAVTALVSGSHKRDRKPPLLSTY